MTADLRDLKEHVDCRELIAADLGPPVRKAQDYAQWRCPLHSDGRTPSLTAWRDGWHCFGCGAHGDAVGWIMRRRGVGFREAVAMLGGDLPMPERKAWPARRTAPPLREPPSRAWREAAAQFAREAHEALLSPIGERARRWLAQRGITLEDVRLWRLGYVPADRKDRWGDVDVFLPRGIAIPHFVGGEVWGVKFRRPQDSPKYICARGSVPSLYGVDLLQGKPDLLLCEGELDTALLYRLVGDTVDTATFGSAGARDIALWLPTLIRYRRIFVGFDNDEAGQKAASAWLAKTKRAKALSAPAGKDWSIAWETWGDNRLREYILTAVQSNGEGGE